MGAKRTLSAEPPESSSTAIHQPPAPTPGSILPPGRAEPSIYPDPKDVRTDLEFATDRLSSQARSMAFGTLAVIWATLIGEDKGLTLDRTLSLLVATLAVATLLLDFFQYLAAYRFGLSVNNALKRDLPTKDYEDWPSFRWRRRLFRWKVLCTLMTAVGLLLLVWVAIY